MKRLDTLIVHHSASRRSVTRDDIDSWHRADPRNWASIGYHWVIEANGLIVPGRSLRSRGAHAGNRWNGRAWGVCVVGDNTHADRKWRAPQIRALRDLTVACATLVPGIWVKGHNEVKATLCPGISGDELREMIR